MRSLAGWVAFLPSVLVAAPAAAESPSTTAAPRAPEVAPVAPSSVEERAFEVEVRRYQRLAEFTKRLIDEREQREFDALAERHRRLSELTRRLAERNEREVELTFEAEVSLFLKKLELTRELAAKSAAASNPSRPPEPDRAPEW